MSKKRNIPNIKSGRLSIFITVESIIIAGLLVWAQYWIDMYTRYSTPSLQQPIWHVGLGVSVIFIAVLLSICSVTSALLIKKNSSNVLPRLSVSMATASLFSMFLVILISLIGSFSTAASDNLWHASVIVTYLDPYRYIVRNIAFIGIPVFVIIIYLFLSNILVSQMFES